MYKLIDYEGNEISHVNLYGNTYHVIEVLWDEVIVNNGYEENDCFYLDEIQEQNSNVNKIIMKD